MSHHGESFHAKGLMVLERNYLDIYKWEKWTGDRIPLFRVGDEFIPKRFQMGEGTTTPPTPLTESDLIAQMDSNKIGTDATICAHIAKIQDRNYVTKDPFGHFHPTDLGKALVVGYFP